MPTLARPRLRDRDIRTALSARVEAQYGADPDTRIVPEMGLAAGAVRVDLAVINGVLHGYEIKSPADTLARLPDQATAYSRACDRVTIVTASDHLAAVLDLVPMWWGVLLVEGGEGGVELVEERPATDNPSRDAYSIAQLLWRDEALQLLEHYGLANGMRSRPRQILWRALADGLELEKLAEEVRVVLRSRPKWRADALPA